MSTLITTRGTYETALVRARADGVDVLLAYLPRGGVRREDLRYLGFRRTGDVWRGLDRGWARRFEAERMLARVQAGAVLERPELVALLDRTAGDVLLDTDDEDVAA
jgi:hypothetical protein